MSDAARDPFARPQPRYAPGAFPPGPATAPELHKNVERFMAGVFAWMAAGLAITAVFALIPALDGYVTVGRLLSASPYAMYALLLLPLPFAFIIPGIIERGSTGTAAAAFFGYAAVLGLALFWIPIVYNAVSIVSIFAVTALMFGGMAAIGFATRRDLGGMGRFLIMMLWGLMATWIVSLFIPGLYWWVAAIGVPVFALLTAWETQQIKQIYLTRGGRNNLAILGALVLYSSFINLFLFLLRLFGGRD